ncbi:MAG TPA: lysylphosphatidylglycerol synthase transmembrane domain-containing protein [Isosphaeraceae bacterium]|nr:lysylphosphatidylglycerol synthase transmembrane domain-containing protein [Isosphaeraceae bacterium]
MTKPKRPLRSIAINLVLAALAFGLLAMAIYKNRDQINEVLHRPLDSRLLTLAFSVFMLAMVLTFLRWYLLVRALQIPFRVRDAMRLGFIGNVFNLVIPGAVGGDLIKAYYLCREQAKKAQAIASMVIDRVVGLLGLFLLAGVMGLGIWPTAGTDVRRLIVVVWAAVITGFVGLAVMFLPALYRPLSQLVAGRKKLESILEELVATASAYRERIGVVAFALGMAMVIHSLYVVAFFTLSLALFPKIPTLGQHFVMVPLALFTTAVPLPFGALGLSEQVSDQLFKLVNHPGGAVAMMGYRVLMYAGGLISACVYLANIRQVKSLTDMASGEPAG